MGNNKFKLSDMIPNAWFYKLKDMSKTRNMTKKKKNNTNTNTNKQNTKKKALLTPITTNTTKTHPKPHHHHHLSHPPNKKLDHPKPSPDSTIRFPEPPRKSSKRRSTSSRRRKPVFRPHSRFVSSSSTETSSSSGSLFPSELDHEEEEDYVDEDEDPFLRLASATWSSSNCNCRLSSSTADIIIDLDTYDHNRAEATKTKSKNKNKKNNNPFKDDVVSELDLPPILTKPINFDDTIFKATKKHRATTTKNSSSSQSSSVNNNNNNNNSHIFARKSSGSNSSSSTGIRLRASSPRLASKKIQACARKSVSSSKQYLSESFAVVKSSVDPQGDFRDSMVEMIVENNIRATRDLEELLTCYLSLNSKDYHDVIVKAFEQIWFDMADIRL